MKDLSGIELRRLTAGVPGRLVPILLVLVLPLLLGAWQDFTGNTINPNYVKRIQDGKTTKTEILAFFGDPKEVEKIGPGAGLQVFQLQGRRARYALHPREAPYPGAIRPTLFRR